MPFNYNILFITIAYLLQQEVYIDGNRAYDRLIIEDEDGKVGDIWFDVSEFFW
jgi:hypothetical protein